MKNIALIFAGGVGQRMNTVSLPKQFLKVHGKEIIIHTIERFQHCDLVDAIIVVCISNYIDFLSRLIQQHNLNKVVKIVPGGSCGQISIFNGLVAAKEISNSDDDIVLIHDGVRPIIDSETIEKNIECVKHNGTAITVAKAHETILYSENDQGIGHALQRNNCYFGRAPQSFYLKDVFSCHLKSKEINKLDFIDTATMMDYFGYKLFPVLGPQNNIKVTTPMDFYFFKAILDFKENEQINKL